MAALRKESIQDGNLIELRSPLGNATSRDSFSGSALSGDQETKIQSEILRFWIYVLFAGYAFVSVSIVIRAGIAVGVMYTTIPVLAGLGSFALLKLGKIRVASILLCVGTAAGLMYSGYHSGGLLAPGIFALVVPLLISTFTLGRKWTAALFGTVVLYVAAVTIIQARGHLPPPVFYQPLENRAVVVLMIIGSVTAMVWWAARRIDLARNLLRKEVDERVAMERQVRLLNQELESRVAERTADLDAFTMMVAHDLRAPVLHLRGFASLLQEKGDEYDEEAKFFVSRMASSAKSMGELIDNLLEFSRHQRDSLKKTRVDMTELVRSIRYELIESGSVDPTWIVVEALPQIESDLALIRQVWVNLIDNAVKYSRHMRQPRVRIYSESIDGVVWYIVEDNGLGFEPTAADQMFTEFQRLHAHVQIPGTGVGLATVKRIVERHGGDIHATGAPNQGAKFRFRLSQEAELPAEPESVA